MTLIQGNALDELQKLDSESVDCCITSPPYYALRDYKQDGMIWDADPSCKHEWQTHEMKLLHENRNNSQGANAQVFANPKRANQAQFSGMANLCSKCNAWKGQLGLEPTFQLYLDHLIQIFTEVKRVLKKSGTCWVVMGDSYNGTSKSLIMIPSRFAIQMIDSGWILRNDIIWYKPNCMPSSAKDRFTVDYEHIFFFTKSKKYYFKTQYEPLNQTHDSLRQIGQNYRGQGTKEYELNNVQNPSDVKRRVIMSMSNHKGRIKRTVWKISPKPFPEAHFAVFPEELVRQCLDAGCPEYVCNKCGKPREYIYKSNNPSKPFQDVDELTKCYASNCKGGNPQSYKSLYRQGTAGVYSTAQFKGLSDCGCDAGFKQGIVIDPFSGAGTVYKVALETDRKPIGIELNPEYIEITKKRIAPLLAQVKLTSLLINNDVN